MAPNPHKQKAYSDFTPEEMSDHEHMRNAFVARMGNLNVRMFNAPCCRCKEPCNGTLMRTHPLYWRTRMMLTEPEVPRHPSGYGILLCYHCQRMAYFAGGFMRLLALTLKREASQAAYVAANPGAAKPRISATNQLPDEVIEQIKTALEAGDSTRKIARDFGVTTRTVARYRSKFFGNTPVMCPCGEPATHAGWCRPRLAQSPARQAFMQRWAEQRSRPPPPPQ